MYRPDTNTVLERILSFSSYDAEGGQFIRTGMTKGPQINQIIGAQIGHIDAKGYRRVEIWHQYYFIHQLVWAIETGDWPHEIDHIDGDITNNRLSNLRNVHRRLNSKNRHKLNRNNTSGLMGVSFHKCTGRYQSYVDANGKRHYAGLHDTAEQAQQARLTLIAQHPEWGFTEAHG